MVAGQLAGVEGYVESAACGLWAGLNAVRFHHNQPPLLFPPSTAMGGLAAHLQNQANENFQPSNITWGHLPPLPPPPPPARKWGKKEKTFALARRAWHDLRIWMQEQGMSPQGPEELDLEVTQSRS
jgi:methylenetetrahydrofolate--tRNA-(uracil-5-)-methyltransferase